MRLVQVVSASGGAVAPRHVQKAARLADRVGVGGVLVIRKQVQDAAQPLTGRYPAWVVQLVSVRSGAVASGPVQQAARLPR